MIEDENGAYTMTYDALNRVETFEDMWGSLLTFSYDAVGNRTKVEDSEGGVQTSTYDAARNLTKREFDGSGLTPLRIDFTYNDNNQVESITRYSNLGGTTTVATTDYTYDKVGRITNLHHEDGSATNISNYTYVYDAVGNLSIEELDGTTTTYQYDDSGQLTDDGVSTHEYDANGNRIDGGYDVGPINQYTTDGTWDFTYDAAGNMTEKEDTVAEIKWEYGYDHMNRLVWVEKIDTTTSDVLMRADYKYDALGNRIEKAVDADGDGAGGTDTTRYSYDGFKTNGLSYVGNENWDIWADLDGDNLNDIEMRYIRGDGIDSLFARHDDSGTVAWYLNDRLGSVRDMTDNSGVVKNTIAYDGFGNITSESDANFGDRYKWTGREHDVETGLQYNRARYYDPTLGRWISKDPLGFAPGDSNLYRYVNNRPTFGTDPSGLVGDIPLGPAKAIGTGAVPPCKAKKPTGSEKGAAGVTPAGDFVDVILAATFKNGKYPWLPNKFKDILAEDGSKDWGDQIGTNKFGKFFVDLNARPATKPGERSGASVAIRFAPSDKVDAHDIAFVQIFKVTDSNGNPVKRAYIVCFR